MLAERAISHSSKLQSIVLLSIYEAEYMAICEAGKEAVWLRYLFEELGVRESAPIELKTDNQGLIARTSNQEFYRRTKNIDVQFDWIQVTVTIKKIEITYINTNNERSFHINFSRYSQVGVLE